MKLIKGDKLTSEQRAEVLRAFVHRWTHENAKPGAAGMMRVGSQSMAPHMLESDAQWLAKHAFYITKSGRLSARHKHCEPHYMAD